MVDLNVCEEGDLLLSSRGQILTYVLKLGPEDYYDHKVKYSNGGYGTRMNDGFVMKHDDRRLPTDHDIIHIFKEKL